jgi:hypothetical protein
MICGNIYTRDGETVKSRLILWLLCGVGLGILPVIRKPDFTSVHKR